MCVGTIMTEIYRLGYEMYVVMGHVYEFAIIGAEALP